MSDCPVYCNDHDHEKVLHITETALKELREDNARIRAVVDAARAQVERWYREPPVAEGGDFMAGMYEMRAALNALDETGKGSAG